MSERARCEALPGAGCKRLSMNFVNLENLEGNVPPPAPLVPGIERNIGPLFQDDQTLAGAKCRAAGPGLFHEAERDRIEAAVRFEVSDEKTDGNLIYSLMA